jgi:hypothetical protein
VEEARQYSAVSPRNCIIAVVFLLFACGQERRSEPQENPRVQQ